MDEVMDLQDIYDTTIEVARTAGKVNLLYHCK